MKILIIYAHPSVESYNHALLDSFLSGLKETNHSYEIIDLYRENFDPVLRNIKSNEVEKDVEFYQEKIQLADYLVFIYPTFWFRAPAILEGFFDRIFTSGFAFKYINTIPKGLLKTKKAVVIETYGGPAFYYRLLFSRIPWRRLKAVLRFCGIKKIIHQPCYKVPFTTDSVRKAYIKKVFQIGKKLV